MSVQNRAGTTTLLQDLHFIKISLDPVHHVHPSNHHIPIFPPSPHSLVILAKCIRVTPTYPQKLTCKIFSGIHRPHNSPKIRISYNIRDLCMSLVRSPTFRSSYRSGLHPLLPALVATTSHIHTRRYPYLPLLRRLLPLQTLRKQSLNQIHHTINAEGIQSHPVGLVLHLSMIPN